MDLGEWFLKGLAEYDSNLSAVFDDQTDEIHLFYVKSGQKSLAYSVAREYGELYPELQRRILKQLPLHDVWKRFGSGQAYDDYLYQEEIKRREEKQKQIDDERFAKMKQERWRFKAAIENAKRGIFSGSGKSFEIPSVSVPADIPKEGRKRESK